MDKILELRTRRAGMIEQMDALLATVPDGADMTEEQVTAYDALKAEDDKIAAELTRLEDLERRRAAAARPAEPLPGNPAPAAGTTPAQPTEKGLTFGRMVRTIAAAGGNHYVAQQMAEANGDSGLFANQNMGTGTAGGFLVPEDVSSEVIELLRPESVVTAMGPRIVPMPNGNMTTNRRASGANFAYGGEQQDAPATGYSYGQVKLSAKKLSGIIPVSNDLLRSSSTAVDRMIRDDAVADASQIQDRYFLRGAGTEYAPKGFRYQHVGTPFEATHVLTMTASPDLQKVDNDLGRMELALGNANVSYTGAHWAMSPRSAMYLTNLRDGNPSDDFDVIAGDATAVNEVENGGFDDGSAWTLGGGWTIGSGVASDTAASGVEDSMTQAVSGIADGTELRVSMVISGSSGGTVLVRLEGDTDVDMGANSDQAKGRLKVAPDNLTAVSVVSDAGWAGNVDNVFVVRETAASVELEQGYFWVVPIAISGVAGTPDGPHDLFVP